MAHDPQINAAPLPGFGVKDLIEAIVVIQPAVFCPTDDRIGPYAYFESRSQSGEDAPYLAGILSHSEEETQYVRFVRSAEN